MKISPQTEIPVGKAPGPTMQAFWSCWAHCNIESAPFGILCRKPHKYTCTSHLKLKFWCLWAWPLGLQCKHSGPAGPTATQNLHDLAYLQKTHKYLCKSHFKLLQCLWAKPLGLQCKHFSPAAPTATENLHHLAYFAETPTNIRANLTSD